VSVTINFTAYLQTTHCKLYDSNCSAWQKLGSTISCYIRNSKFCDLKFQASKFL